MSNAAKWIMGAILVTALVLLVVFTGSQNNVTGGEPVKFGQISARSGIGASIGEEEFNGAVLAVEEINESGGVLGRPLELISEDVSLDKLREAGSAVQKLINSDNVVAIIGPQWDEPALAIAPIIEEAQIPTISPNLTQVAEQDQSYDYLFSTWYSNEVGTKEILKFANERGWTDVMIVQPAKGGFWELVSGYFRIFAPEYGITVIGEEFGTDLGSTNYRSLILKAKQLNPDAVFGTFAEFECPFLKQASELGLEAPLISTESAGTPTALDNCGDILEGKLYFSTPVQNERYQEFALAYKERFGHEPRTPSAVTSYDAVRVTAAAIEEAGTTESQAVRDALSEIEFTNSVSLPRIKFDDKGYVITPATAFEVQSVKSGEFVNVTE